MSVQNPRTRMIYVVIWAGGFLALMLYAQNGHIGTGSFIILGALLIIFLAIVGIVLALYEELGKGHDSSHDPQWGRTPAFVASCPSRERGQPAEPGTAES